MRIRIMWLGLAVLLGVAATGCSKREELKVAEFKDQKITVADFEQAYERVDPAYLPKATGQEGKVEFLNTMLNKYVMAYKADELGYDKDPTVAQGMEVFSRMALQVAYLKKQVADKITVSDEEVRKHYDNQGVSMECKQILCDTPDQAEEAYQAIQDGQDFDAVLRQYSKNEDASTGGMVFSAVYGQLTPEMQQALFSVPVGGVTPPVVTAHGWVINKVLRRNEGRTKPPYEEVKEEYTTQVKNLKEAVALNAYTNKLRDDYGVVWHYDNIGIVYNALPPDRDFDDAPARSTEIYPLLLIDPADLDKPMVTWQGGKQITIKDFSDFYDQASFFNRPRRNTRWGGIRQFLTERIMNEISTDVVRKSGIENDPEVAKALRAKKEEIMVNLLYDDVINKQTVVTHQEIVDYYDGNLEAFHTPERRRFGVILAGDVETAQQAYKDLRAGQSFRTVMLAYSVDEETKQNNGETQDLARGQQPELDPIGFSLQKVGDVSEPFQTSRGWMLLKLVERIDEKYFSLEEAEGRIESAVKQNKNDERLKEMLAKWKEEVGVVIYEDNLAKTRIVERQPAADVFDPKSLN
ncbi:MAG: peptidyl-prolyl cis-trans isomerase [Candidatus Latescibacteria bacterium]|nr:peptidyl-prolyl cis-trans isomerase [Candidatus Latescibacterota bacterium]